MCVPRCVTGIDSYNKRPPTRQQCPDCARVSIQIVAVASFIIPCCDAAMLSAVCLHIIRYIARPGCIISLSIQKLAEKAKSPPCQPRLSQSPLCAPWQPQAVREQIRYTLAAPGCQEGQNLPPDSPKLSESQ